MDTAAHTVRAKGRRILKRARFGTTDNEAAMLREAAGDGVVRLLDVKRGTLVLERIVGPSLADVLARRALKPSEIARIAARLAAVLDRVHEAGVVHGDVKPENVLLPRGKLDRAVLIDFDTARRKGDAWGPRLTTAFTAPERMMASAVADPRADIFALGALLHACAHRASPFQAGTRDATILAILASEPPPTHPAIAAMLRKEAELRPATAGEAVRALSAERKKGDRWIDPETPYAADAFTIRTALDLDDAASWDEAHAKLVALVGKGKEAEIVADILAGRSSTLAFDVELLREKRRHAVRTVLEAIGSPAPPSSRAAEVDQPAALVAEAHPTAYAPLARAFAREGQPLRAAHHAYRAARLALESGDLDAAERFLDSADGYLVPGSAVVPALFSGLVDATRAQIKRWRGRHDEASHLARRALARLPAGSVPWCEAIGERATAAGKLGDQSEVLAVSAALRASKPPTESPFAWDRACSRTVVQLFFGNEQREARALLRWFVKHTTPERRGFSPGALVTAALFDGRLDDHLDALRDAVTAFSRAGDRRSTVLYGSAVGYAWCMVGEWGRATRALTAALPNATDVGLPALVQHNLGWAFAHVRHGRDAAIHVESAAIDVFRAQKDRRFLAGSLAYRSQMYLRNGDLDRAEADAREAMEVAGSSPLVQAAMADALLARGNAGVARDLAVAAVRAAEAANPPEAGEALASLVLARSLRALGDAREAKRVARTAWNRIRRRAARIRNTALRASFLEKVPEHRALRSLVLGSTA